MIWSVLFLMTAGALLGVLWPFSRGVADDPARGLASNFYQAQVDAIERDRQAALIDDEDARIARALAARRALADAKSAGDNAVRAGRLRKVTALAVAVLLPALAFGLYARIGTPTMPDDPLAARLAATGDNADANIMIARVEAQLKKHPDDVRGFELLAPIYLRLGRVQEAVAAYRRIITLKGESGPVRADYGEALVAEANGVVTPQALASFDKALKLEPDNAKARYYQGLAAAQSGDKARALSLWRALVASAPPDAGWVDMVKARIAQVSGQQQGPQGGPAGPMAAAVRAMPPAAQLTMIHAMVAKLSDRLQTQGNDPAGWQQLIRSLVVLKENDKARVALANARKALAANQAGWSQVEALAQNLGLKTP
ncbi:MAG: c-type cytochrome biogenesis protein CcmI [Hyphomicrobiales bacterium]|nr:c-type cytochrome biogenesis protein CcmI [Hyphomicrobiales bacterium]